MMSEPMSDALFHALAEERRTGAALSAARGYRSGATDEDIERLDRQYRIAQRRRIDLDPDVG